MSLSKACFASAPAVARVKIAFWLMLCWLSAAASSFAQYVEIPSMSIGGGDFVLNQTVVVTCATPGATIHYTIGSSYADLAFPTEGDPVIASGGSIVVDRPMAVAFRAFKAGMAPSDWTGTEFRITGKLAAAGNHTIALKSNGEVWAWGSNTNGQLGDGTAGTAPRPTPSRVRSDASNFLTNVSSVAAGTSHTIALKNDGTVVAWGLNSSGQLGDGTIVQKLYPVTVKLPNGTPLSGITQIACGGTHSLALKSDGTVWTWGANASGQIGDGTTTSPRSFATQVKVNASAFLTTVVSIAGGSAHSAAVKSDGTVWTWGLNSSGQLGNNTVKSSSFPVQVITASGALTSATQVFCGANHTLVNGGVMWACGANANGQLGDGTTTQRKVAVQTVYPPAPPFQPNPSPVYGVGRMAAGSAHTAIMLTGSDGYGAYYAYLQTTGLNTSGQLGSGSTTQRVYPDSVPMNPNPPPTGNVAAGTNHTVASHLDGSVWAWGANTAGQAGQSNTSAVFTSPTKITTFGIVEALEDSDGDTLPNWEERSLGTNPYNSDTDGDGLADSWEITYGFNPLVYDAPGDPDGDGFTNAQESQNGTDPYDFYNGGVPVFNPNGGWFPTEQSVLVSFVTPSATIYYTKNGVVPTSADKTLIPGSTLLIDRPLTLEANALKAGLAPTATTIATFVISGKVAGGTTHSLGLKSDGTVWAWGGNANGQLGIGSADSSAHATPLQVKQDATTLLTGISFVDAGTSHSLAIRKSDGAVFGWGSDSSGQLGDNSTATQQVYPIQAKTTATGNPILTGIVDVAGGAAHSIALKSDGTVWTWGSNSSGQLGDGSTTTRKLAAQVKTGTNTFLTGVVIIAAGDNFCAALKSDGTVWTWGANASGQLGIGSTTQKSFATQVTGFWTAVTDIACGASHMLAADANAQVWSWGNNANGQLGKGSTTQINAPVRLETSPGNVLTGALAVAAGASHSAILMQNGSVYTCGLNSSGQLAINSTTQQTFATMALSNAGIIDLACGANHTLFTAGNGIVSASGLNASGQAGSSPTTINPKVSTPLSNFIIIVAFADPDGDGLLTWHERELGTNPFNADTDADGMPDGWEVTYSLNPLLNDASSDPDGEGFTNLQEFQNGTNPLDYYNGQPFNLAIFSGSGQTGPGGMWLPAPMVVQMTRNGTPLVNAAVTFTITTTGAGVSATSEGTTSSTLQLNTDSSGKAAVYYRQPNVPDMPSEVTATAGTTAPQTVRFGASTADIPVNGLKLWLNAQAGVVLDGEGATFWTDQSPAGNSAIWNSAQPPWWRTNVIAGKPAVRFTAASVYWYATAMNGPLSLGSETSIFSVSAATGSCNGCPVYDMRMLWNENNLFFGNDHVANFATLYGNGTSWNNTTSHRLNLGYGGFSILEAVNSGTASAYVNGVLIDSTTQPMTPFSDGYDLGVNWSGDLAELLVYDRALTAAERVTVENYLNRRYAVISAPPTAPANLVGNSPTSTQTTLNWDSFPGVLFKIERKTGAGGAYAQVAVTPTAGFTVYHDSALTPGTQYFYRIRATNMVGDSAYSNETSVTTPSTGVALPLDGLKLWLRSDFGVVKEGTSITKWIDESGNHNDAVPGVPTARPLLGQNMLSGKPMVRFNGSDKVLNLPDFLRNKATAAEAFVVLKTAADQSASTNGLWSFGTQWMTPKYYPAADGSISDDFGATGILGMMPPPGVHLSEPHVYSVLSKPGEWTARINEQVIGTTASFTVGFRSDPSIGYASGFGWGPHSYFVGDIAEILIFDRALTAADRSAVNSYLTAKYGLGDEDNNGVTDWKDYAVANLPPDTDGNEDGIPDWLELRLGLDPTNLDMDADGVSNATERALGTNPFRADTDGDGVNDGQDAYALDPTRWQAPGPDPSDQTPPTITLTEPVDAILQP